MQETEIYSLGIDFGSTSVRVLLANIQTGDVIADAASNYSYASNGIFTDQKDNNVARQDANDYLDSLKKAMKNLQKVPALNDFNWKNVKGIGIDATGSTVIPVTKDMKPVSQLLEFCSNLNAKAWMWKDHTSQKEADAITSLAKTMRPEYLKKCGGSYSSEWFWSKVLHCANVDAAVFNSAYTFVEFSDYIPAVLAGVKNADEIKRNKCAASHKALYDENLGGYPDNEFLNELDTRLLRIRLTLPIKTFAVNEIAGFLSNEWAKELNLPVGTPIAMGALDAHVGAIGSGVKDKTLVKVIGTSTCDITVGKDKDINIVGVSGIADDSVLPGYLGIEAGQSAVGDIFNWFVTHVLKGTESCHKRLTEHASKLQPGQSGLLALDWNNGNRNILSDANLSGLLVGQSLHTKDFEIYRALIESTAYGAKRIIDQIEDCGVCIDNIICCGGIPQKNALLMQIYADVLNCTIQITAIDETVALGAAMLGALAYYKNSKDANELETLQKRFCRNSEVKYVPNKENVKIYKQLYILWLQVHDAFGIADEKISLYNVMKNLIQLKKLN